MKPGIKHVAGSGERGWIAWAVVAALALVLWAVVKVLFAFMLLD